MSKHQATVIAKKYARELARAGFVFKQVYLFGSYSENRAQLHSDIDLAVIAKHPGSRSSYLKKKMSLWRIAAEVDTRIEPVLLSSMDIKTSTASPIGEQVRIHGIRIV